MGGPARPLHEPGNHRSSERCSHRHSADCGSLIEQLNAAQDSRSYTTPWGTIGQQTLINLIWAKRTPGTTQARKALKRGKSPDSLRCRARPEPCNQSLECTANFLAR